MDKKRIAIDFAKSLNFPEIEEIILFGSVARGEDNNNLDIDILVISKDKYKIKNKILDLVIDFLFKNKVFISARAISSDYYEKYKDTFFLSTVKKEGIVLE
jgi:predicted nucleotidyltransferase